jgi:UDP-N-acetylglucosamine acyltransferase
VAIHPTAIIDSRAEIDPTAEIGAYAVIDGPVRVGPATRVMAHSILKGWTELGAGNVVHPFAVIGDAPQDLSYDGSRSYVRIGERNVIRESVHIHRGTKAESVTQIGDDNYLMTNVHIAHNCRLGNRNILATGAVLGGYVEVADQAFISGNCVVHQFVRIGRLSLLRGLSRANRDVPPFCIMDLTSVVRALNLVGLRRAGLSGAQIRALRRAFATLFGRAGNLALRLQRLESQEMSPEVREMVEFIRTSKRGVSRGLRGREQAEAE